MHASGTAGALDIYITEPGANLAHENEDGTPLYSPIGTGLSLRSASSYLAVAAGSYDITFTRTVPEDETPPEVPEIKHGPISVTFAKGGIYSLLLRDEASEPAHQWLDGAPEATATP
jgi:hypothetical protein